MKKYLLLLVLIVSLVGMSGVGSAAITGVPPNPTGDTIIDQDTVWDGESNINSGGNIIVGNPTKRIYFDSMAK